jgi:hypothetical protein
MGIELNSSNHSNQVQRHPGQYQSFWILHFTNVKVILVGEKQLEQICSLPVKQCKFHKKLTPSET